MHFPVNCLRKTSRNRNTCQIQTEIFLSYQYKGKCMISHCDSPTSLPAAASRTAEFHRPGGGGSGGEMKAAICCAGAGSTERKQA